MAVGLEHVVWRCARIYHHSPPYTHIHTYIPARRCIMPPPPPDANKCGGSSAAKAPGIAIEMPSLSSPSSSSPAARRCCRARMAWCVWGVCCE